MCRKQCLERGIPVPIAIPAAGTTAQFVQSLIVRIQRIKERTRISRVDKDRKAQFTSPFHEHYNPGIVRWDQASVRSANARRSHSI